MVARLEENMAEMHHFWGFMPFFSYKESVCSVSRLEGVVLCFMSSAHISGGCPSQNRSSRVWTCEGGPRLRAAIRAVGVELEPLQQRVQRGGGGGGCS